MEETLPNAFSRTLESIRESRGSNRLEFAKAIDFDRAGYYAIINGKRPGHLFVKKVLALESLTEAEKKQLLQAYLQLHLEDLDADAPWAVQLRSVR